MPLALFVVVPCSCCPPLQNAFSRHLEAEADWSALQATHDPAAARALFRRFTRVARVEPTSPGWATLMLENHPTIMQRIEMVEAFARRQAAAG